MVNRRGFIIGGLAAGSAGMFLGGAWLKSTYPDRVCEADHQERIRAQDDSFLPNNNSHDEAAFWQQAYRARPFTLVGDTNHADRKQILFFLSGRNIDYLQQSGTRNIYLEGTAATQARVQEIIAEGGIEPPKESYDIEGLSEDELVSLEWNALVSFCAETERRGMQCHFPDDMDTSIDPVRLSRYHAYQDNLRAAFAERCGSTGNPTTRFTAAYALRNPIDFYLFYKDRALVEEARSDDQQIHRNIMRTASPTGNVIFYGAAHMDNSPDSLKSLIGRENYIHINMFGDRGQHASVRASPPDFLFIADDRTGYQSGFKSLESFTSPAMAPDTPRP